MNNGRESPDDGVRQILIDLVANARNSQAKGDRIDPAILQIRNMVLDQLIGYIELYDADDTLIDRAVKDVRNKFRKDMTERWLQLCA